MTEFINYVPLRDSWEEIEKRLGITLPKDFKEFVSKYNKGMPIENSFSYEGGVGFIKELLSFNETSKTNVYRTITDDMKEKRIVPFAFLTNSTGDYLSAWYVCIKGKIVILYNQKTKEEIFVDHSFFEFIGSLKYQYCFK